MTFDMQSSSATGDWLIFLAVLLAIGLGLALFAVWFFTLRNGSKKKRKRRHRHHKHINPTLAETGGLPPVRHPDEPPKGV
jgi:hypothetical protein